MDFLIMLGLLEESIYRGGCFMIHAVWGLCVCDCVSHPVSCPSVGMEVLQVTQSPINDLYQSWFPSRLSSFQRQMWRPQPAHSELHYQTGGRLLGVCSICSGWMDTQPFILWTLDFLHDFSDSKIAALRCDTIDLCGLNRFRQEEDVLIQF